MPEKKKKYGCFSQKAADSGRGTIWYRTPDGGEVEVTMIDSDPQCSANKWDDKILLGEVAGFIRMGRPSRSKHLG